MSLINKMLRDLDKRHAKSKEPGAEVPGDVRPSVRRSNKPLIYASAGVLTILLAAGGGYWGYQRYKAKPVVAAPPAILPTPVVAAASIVNTAPAELSAASTLAALSTTPAEPAKALSTEPIKAVSTEPVKLADAAPPKEAEKPAESAKVQPSRPEPGKAKSKLIPAEPTPAEPRSPRRPVAKYAGTPGEPPLASQDTAISKQARPSGQSANSLLQKAVDLAQQGRSSEARSELYTAIQLDPQNVSVRKLLISLLIDAKQMAEAERLALEGTQVLPQHREFYSLLGRLQVERGDGPSALASLRRGLGHAAGDPEYLSFFALVLQRQEQHAEAVEYFRRALRLRSEGRWLVALGISLMADRHLAEAQEAFQAARATSLPAQLNAFAEQRLREIQQMMKQKQLTDTPRQDTGQ